MKNYHIIIYMQKNENMWGTSGYLGGRDQEDQGSKPAWANSSLDSISKIPNTKKG
jgi:hypothetical protein